MFFIAFCVYQKLFFQLLIDSSKPHTLRPQSRSLQLKHKRLRGAAHVGAILQCQMVFVYLVFGHLDTLDAFLACMLMRA